MITSLLRFTNIILAALLGGVSFAIWIGFDPQHLSPAAYLEQQQNMIRSLSVLMGTLVVITILITILSALRQRNDKGIFFSLIIAALLLVSCILITLFGNRAIDNMMLGWTSGTMPADWASTRDKWWSLHILRTVVELAALCIITWTAIKKGYDHPVVKLAVV